MTSHWAANYHATLALRELMPQSWPECNCCEYFSFIIWKIADGGCQNDVALSFDVIFSLLIPWLTVETTHVYVHVVCSMLTRYRFYHYRVIGANFEVSCEIVSININFSDTDKASDNSLVNYSKKCVTFTICSVFKGNTPLRLSTFRLLQVRLVYYAFYNFAFYNFAWNVIVRHLVYLTSVFHNVSNLCTVILDFIPGVLVTWQNES